MQKEKDEKKEEKKIQEDNIEKETKNNKKTEKNLKDNKEEKIKKTEIKEEKKEEKKNETVNQTNLIEESNLETVDEIEISKNVINTIAGVAIAEVKGVEMSTGLLDVLKSKTKEGRGIKVEVKNDKVFIDAYVLVEYGLRIPDVAFEIQNKVKKSVEDMTGFRVDEVNVHVQGIIKVSENRNEDSEEE